MYCIYLQAHGKDNFYPLQIFDIFFFDYVVVLFPESFLLHDNFYSDFKICASIKN